MRKFKQNKLWRDKAIDLMEQYGSRIQWRCLSHDEFIEQLRLKLLEEAAEVAEAKSRQELITELADVLEVIDTIAIANNISIDEITEVKRTKHELRGGFLKRIFVEISEHPAGSPGEQYCLREPSRYPEIGDDGEEKGIITA